MSRSTVTLVLATRDMLVRADIRGGDRPRLLGLWQELTGAGVTTAGDGFADPALQVATALRLHTRRPRRVWVLTTALWSQMLHVPGVTADLPRSERERALAFEAEPLSGIAALTSAVGAQAAGDGVWHVLQMPGSERDAVATSVREAGGQLQGIIHPGGCPRALQPDPGGGAWQRIELWPDDVIGLHGEPGYPVQIGMQHVDPLADGWQEPLHDWLASVGQPGVRDLLVTPTTAAVIGDPPDGRVVSLANPAALEHWLLMHAAQLAQRDPGVPMIGPPPRKRSKAGLIAAGVLLELAALGGAFAHYQHTQQREAALEKRVEAWTARRKQTNEIRRQVQQARRDTTAATQRATELRTRLNEVRRDAGAIRTRVAQVLRVLAEFGRDDLLVTGIRAENRDLVISGLALDPGCPNELASRVARAVAGCGWAVQPPQKTAHERLPGGGPWGFELRLAGPGSRSGAGGNDPAVPRPHRGPVNADIFVPTSVQEDIR